MKITSVWRAIVRIVGACVAVLVVSLAGLPTDLARGQSGGSCSIDDKSWAPNPQSIAAGKTSQVTVYFTCYSPTAAQNATFTVQIPGLPKGATWSPTTISTVNGYSGIQTITISTTPATPSGTYPVAVGGTSTNTYCPTIVPPCGAPGNANGNWTLTITGTQKPPPTIACASSSKVCPNLWWFNGVAPQPENYSTTLKASPKGAKKYTWAIQDGNARLAEGTGDTVEVFPSGDPGPNEGIVHVTVTVNGVESAPFKLSARKPYKLMPNNPATVDHAAHIALGGGYTSLTHFSIVDQTGEVLPQPVDTSGAVYGGETRDYPYNAIRGWSPAGLLSVPVFVANPGDYTIIIDSPVRFSEVDPEPVSPCKPELCGTRVAHQSAYVTVGSQNKHKGVQVATFASQNFTDHGRVCSLVSPSASDLPGEDLPVNPDPNATVCPP